MAKIVIFRWIIASVGDEVVAVHQSTSVSDLPDRRRYGMQKSYDISEKKRSLFFQLRSKSRSGIEMNRYY